MHECSIIRKVLARLPAHNPALKPRIFYKICVEGRVFNHVFGAILCADGKTYRTALRRPDGSLFELFYTAEEVSKALQKGKWIEVPEEV